jgi:hypothetical protein
MKSGVFWDVKPVPEDTTRHSHRSENLKSYRLPLTHFWHRNNSSLTNRPALMLIIITSIRTLVSCY